MTGVIAALAGLRGSPYVGSNTVTVGYFDNGSNARYYGFATSLFGSVSPANWASSGLPISYLQYIDAYGFGTKTIQFSVTGNAPNSGWTTMDIAGTVYNRADASYSFDGTTSTWNWGPSATNSFGTTVGATKVVTWA